LLFSLVDLTPSDKERFLKDLTRAILKYDFRNPPVIFGRYIYRRFSQITKSEDPFKKEKIRIEGFLKKIISPIERFVDTSPDPLLSAAKLAVWANSIDFGAGNRPNLRHLKEELKKMKFKINHFRIFKDKLYEAKNILVLADNAGETFFDRIFLKEIRREKDNLNIFYATRSGPIINDAQIQDAKKAGIDSYARVISSGCDYPGIILSKASKYFERIYAQAEVIISKGQGNFESLHDRKKHIFYLFKVKCLAVSNYLSLPAGSLLFLYNKNIPIF
jgi:hypothetical protein